MVGPVRLPHQLHEAVSGWDASFSIPPSELAVILLLITVIGADSAPSWTLMPYSALLRMLLVAVIRPFAPTYWLWIRSAENAVEVTVFEEN